MREREDVDEAQFPNVTADGLRYTDLMVMQSVAGYYIGRSCWDEEGSFEEPYSRESGYFPTSEAARLAMKNGFAVRDCIENKHGYAVGDLPRLTPVGGHIHTSDDDARMAEMRDAVAVVLDVAPARLLVTYDDRPGPDGLCVWSFKIDGEEVSAEQEARITAALRLGLVTPSGQELRWR